MIKSGSYDGQENGQEDYICQKCSKVYPGINFTDTSSQACIKKCPEPHFYILWPKFLVLYIIVDLIQKNENRVTRQIESANAHSVDELESILEENEFAYGCVQNDENPNILKFHKQHFLILIVKWLLINMYGRRPGFLNSQLSDKQLQNKLRYCQDYLNSLNIIDAGISDNRGNII